MSRRWKLLVFAISLLIAVPARGDLITGAILADLGAHYEKQNAGTATMTERADATFFLGYVAGLFDYLNLAKLICPPNNTTSGQSAVVVAKYLKEHPDRWSNKSSILIMFALEEAFPCK